MTQKSLFWVHARKKWKQYFDEMSVFLAALFTVVKIWKQLKCPSADEWIKNVLNYIYVSISYIVSETGGHCTKWNKPETERKRPYDLTYIHILKKLNT